MTLKELRKQVSAPRDAIADLVHEHRILLSVADAFERYGQLLPLGAEPNDLMRFCVFFREYGSLIHHEKEERIAVAALSLHGYRPGGGPRARLHEEHENERAMLLHVIRYALSTESWEQKDRERIQALATSYCATLRMHLELEEEQLYPALRSTLSEEELASVARKLRRFDDTHNISGQLDWLLEVAEDLEQKYAPEASGSDPT